MTAPYGLLGWAHVVWLLTIAAVVTLFWSIFDRKRLEYRRLHAWLRLVVRESQRQYRRNRDREDGNSQ
jgi:hypothetical protein